jgi:hypothetical protein
VKGAAIEVAGCQPNIFTSKMFCRIFNSCDTQAGNNNEQQQSIMVYQTTHRGWQALIIFSLTTDLSSDTPPAYLEMTTLLPV